MTVDMAFLAFSSVCVGIFAFCIWGMICNELTARQREAIIELVFTPEFYGSYPNYKKVEYFQHMWALVFFRDPFKLYGSEIQRALGRAS